MLSFLFETSGQRGCVRLCLCLCRCRCRCRCLCLSLSLSLCRCLLKQRMMKVVVTTGLGLLELLVVQSSSQIITTNKPTSSFFTGRMPFLSPNQQCQSTEGKSASLSANTITETQSPKRTYSVRALQVIVGNILYEESCSRLNLISLADRLVCVVH